MSEVLDVVVVGGGVTGLTSAYALKLSRPDLSVRLLEARDRIGGNIRTEHVEGHLIDAGPDSFLRTKPEAAALCRELGLETEFLTTRTEARSAYVVHRGRLQRLPAGMVLAVPTRLRPMLQTPLLSWRGKFRVMADLVLPRRQQGLGDESIAQFLTRRFGAEASTRIGAPLLGGIYAGDISTLSVRATFPQLAELEDRFGSVIYGLFETQRARSRVGQNGERPRGKLSQARAVTQWMRRQSEHAESPFLSLKGGLGVLIERLRARLPADGVVTGTGVQAIERDGAGFCLRTERGSIRSRAVVLAAPAHAAARMLPQGLLASELSQIPYVSTATVFFSIPAAALGRKLDGLGFIVPSGEGELLAGTWVSSKWEGRAPEGSVLVRAFLGGVQGASVLERSDAELSELARNELERLMGPFGEPRFTRVYRYPNANPQPLVGHPARLERLRAELGTLPGLALCGAAYDGVGIPDCVRQGRAAAQRVLGLF